MKFVGQCIKLEKIIREEPQAQKQNALCAFQLQIFGFRLGLEYK